MLILGLFQKVVKEIRIITRCFLTSLEYLHLIKFVWYNKYMKSKTIKFCIVVFNLLFFVSLGLCIGFDFSQPYMAIFITMLMFAFHVDIRLVTAGLTRLFAKNINFNSKIFKISTKEYEFLEKLKVKKWKDNYVTWNKNQFTLSLKLGEVSINRVLKNNVMAEITHIFCIITSSIAILVGCLLSKDEWWLYVLTTVLSDIFCDILPILIQRYNRYRLQKIQEKLKN